MTDFLNYKFRCSGLANLLVDPRSKSEPLSDTTKTYLKELWIKEVFGREKIIQTKQMAKGIACETDSIGLVEKVLGKKYFKNQKTLENEYLTGTPDIIDADFVLDIKTSWDLWTFAGIDEDCAKKTYYAQLLGYMVLTGKTKAKLAYCLPNVPEEQIQNELYYLKITGAIKDTSEDETKARANYIFDDIPEERRVRVYDFEMEKEILNKLAERIKAARFYMNSLDL